MSLVSIRGHITSKLDEVNTVLDSGRGGWCREIGASTADLVAEIHALSVAFDGPTSMNTHQYTNTHRGGKTIKLSKPTLWANVPGIF